MSFSDWIGFSGVTILLLAFFLNLAGKLAVSSPLYSLLNMIGAGMACLASVMINYLPFIILEGIWTIVSVLALIRGLVKK
ncbi:MAG: hypothetical protein ACJ76F_02065 [Bacteroidia bacterium]